MTKNKQTTIILARTFPIFIIIMGAVLPAVVFAGNVGPNSPSSAVNDSSYGTGAWGNPSGATTSDNSYASINNAGGPTNYLKATGFGFDIPEGAIINGIKVEIEKKSNVANIITDSQVVLVKNGAPQLGNKAVSGFWTTSDAYATYGNLNDTWETSWEPSDINASNFGVAISANVPNCGNQGGTGDEGSLPLAFIDVIINFFFPKVYAYTVCTASIDHVRITVSYTEITEGIGYLQIISYTCEYEGGCSGNGDNIFNYTIEPLSSTVSVTTINGFGSSGAIELSPGTIYSLTETPQPGWTISSYPVASTCTNGTFSSIIIEPNQTTVCTFLHIKNGPDRLIEPTPAFSMGKLLIVRHIGMKYYKSGYSKIFEMFNYQVTGPTSFTRNLIFYNSAYNGPAFVSTTNTNKNAKQIPVKPGLYSITEETPSGWSLDFAYCSKEYELSPGGVKNVVVEPGETTVCTFNGRTTAEPTVTASTGFLRILTQGEGPFNYFIALTSTYIVAPPIKTNGTNSILGYDSNSGGITYLTGKVNGDSGLLEVSTSYYQTTTANYQVEVSGANTASCDTGGVVLKERPNTVFLVPVIPGETTTCTFARVNPSPPGPGRLKIITNTIGGEGVFSYAVKSIIKNFQFSDVPHPNYLYLIYTGFPNETPDNTQSFTTIDGVAESEEIGVDAGRKIYNIEQKSSGEWTLNDASCDDRTSNIGLEEINPFLGDPGVQAYLTNITIKPGQTTICTFTYTKKVSPGYLEIETFSVGGDDSFEYQIFPTPSIITVDTLNGSGKSEPIELPTGTVYNVGQILPEGWISPQLPTCTTDNSGSAKVTISPGSKASCTFVNYGTTPPEIPGGSSRGGGASDPTEDVQAPKRPDTNPLDN